MSSSPPPSSSATPPSSSSAASPPPPSSLSPPPTSNSPPPSSPSPDPSAPPPTPPPPSSPPSSPPTPAASSPPPATTSPPSSSPPPSASSPPPPTPVASPPPPITVSPPLTPAASTPPPITISPPPPAATFPPPPTAASPPPPTSASPPPPTAASPPPPSGPSSPRPTPNAPPPSSGSPPPPPSAEPPTRTSPPPPSGEPPKSSPSPPLPPRSPSSPSIPSAPPPKSPLPPPRSPPASPPSNFSGGTIPSPPQTSPSLPSPTIPLDNSTNPISPSSNKSSTSGSDVVSSNSPGGGGIKTSTAVSLGVVVVFVILCFLGLAVWLVRKRRKPAAGYVAGFVMPSPCSSSIVSASAFSLPESPHPRSPSAPLVYHRKSGSVASEGGIVNAQSCFSYDELYEITDGFSPQNILGEGGFGCVYKGCLPDGREVAVKQLKVGSGQGEREFRAEVEIISRVHHRHLVSLVGYCIAENQRLLVYDFVPNNTLHSHLHGEGKPTIDWPTRVKVAAGAAGGIAYLHEDCHPRIIHRDIKSSNILLDNNFEAQVSDFGLARLAMDAKTHVTTRVIGTFGYLAPEYASSGKLTERSDVYSFGVVLLELITGRKPVDDTQPMGDESLVEWARPRLTQALETGDFGELPDPRLEKNYNETEMFRMIEAAAACIRHSAAMRPQMGKVVRVLDDLVDVDLNNGVKPGQSEIFNVVESAEIRLFQRMAFGSQIFGSGYSQSNWSHQSEL